MNKPRLKRCPFCGSRASADEGDRYFIVGCTNDKGVDCDITTSDVEPGRAVERWNRRPPRKHRLQPEVLKEKS